MGIFQLISSFSARTLKFKQGFFQTKSWENLEDSELHVSTSRIAAIKFGLISTTKRLTWEQDGRPILSVVLLMLKELFLKRLVSRPSSLTLLFVSVSVSN